MTIERAIDAGVAAVTAGGVTAISLAKGTDMNEWALWVLSGCAGIAAAYVTFRITTESRFTALETRIASAATITHVAEIQGRLDILASEQHHRREVIDRMDKRIEVIAQRLGVV